MATIPIYRLRLERAGTVHTPERRVPSSVEAAQLLHEYVGDADREQFVVLTLDTKGYATGLHTVAMGTLDSVTVHPREVFKMAILINAAAIIVGHNHPSGDPTPSPEDHRVTQRLVRAGELLGIPVWDHLVLGEAGAFVSTLLRGRRGGLSVCSS
ncbi:JAB domain-containing protein [Sulfobacillus thermosulfidooxidans]|uniref:JAB domain-containing protein n=1 Tax=Sulfobacillus thermosulfidooxidans TaxID=28034 RepID=UPI0003183E4F|nr:JAB domain-containing protein [Sulfobacillus thermosulfidooxidans]